MEWLKGKRVGVYTLDLPFDTKDANDLWLVGLVTNVSQLGFEMEMERYGLATYSSSERPVCSFLWADMSEMQFVTLKQTDIEGAQRGG